MQCCLEPLGQYCIGFWPVQCYPKSNKTTLHRICSYTKLSGASWTTLHRVSSCAIFPKSIKTNLQRIFSYALLLGTSRILLHKVLTCSKLSQEYWDKISEDFSYAMLSRASRTTWQGFLPVQCCPKSIKAKLHRTFWCNVIWSLSNNMV